MGERASKLTERLRDRAATLDARALTNFRLETVRVDADLLREAAAALEQAEKAQADRLAEALAPLVEYQKQLREKLEQAEKALRAIVDLPEPCSTARKAREFAREALAGLGGTDRQE